MTNSKANQTFGSENKWGTLPHNLESGYLWISSLNIILPGHRIVVEA